ncbi:hypothetical protein [Candidatus Magnetobacterium casense]|uniref:Uncharacterized protein n=1 Tax=Candidatus Magnetobacterium casense TaxID=1455061 RepID=A0ABS6RY92_9BACT|nr:hypothetical protein [Candidatus Magnetobacterium casensis]MBV6341609.1 hypothetical protein [Candidatus Magnetobacterium casensis]
MQWSINKISNFFLTLPSCAKTWDNVKSFGEEVEDKYWKTINPNICQADIKEERDYIIARLLEVTRPVSALNFCRSDVKKVSPNLLAEMLEGMLAGKEPDVRLWEHWDIGKAIEHLEASLSDKDRLIKLEFWLTPFLCYGEDCKTKFLHKEIMNDPSLFCELICILYKSKDGEREEEVTEGQKNMARITYRILESCRTQPGTLPDGTIDPLRFAEFIAEVPELTR